MKGGVNLKKRFLTLLLAVLSTFTSTNFIFAAVHHTSYQPCNVGTNAVDPWALQPPDAPWCFDTCMKIVLKDYKQKNIANFTGQLNPQQTNINAIIEAPVPEEEIVHRVLLDNHAMGETDTIKNALGAYRDAFLGHVTNFFDYCLGNRTVHGKVGNIDNMKKIGLLNGLFEVALEDELNDLWSSLDADTRKMIVQETAQAGLNSLQKDTGIVGTIHDINVTSNATDLGEYNTALRAIIDEIETNNRMVVLLFENTNDPQKSHACVAYATKRDDMQPQNLQEMKVYNPWGIPITVDYTNQGPLFDITSALGGQKNWLLNKYVAFNY